MKSFEWKRLKVTVEAKGSDVPPWEKETRFSVMRYEVCVSMGLVSPMGLVYHRTTAYGSRHEHEKWLHMQHVQKKSQLAADEILDYKGIAAMVVDELWSALSDPDEFLVGVVEGRKGTAQLTALRTGEATILAAARFGPALGEAADVLREEGLL